MYCGKCILTSANTGHTASTRTLADHMNGHAFWIKQIWLHVKKKKNQCVHLVVPPTPTQTFSWEGTENHNCTTMYWQLSHDAILLFLRYWILLSRLSILHVFSCFVYLAFTAYFLYTCWPPTSSKWISHISLSLRLRIKVRCLMILC